MRWRSRGTDKAKWARWLPHARDIYWITATFVKPLPILSCFLFRLHATLCILYVQVQLALFVWQIMLHMYKICKVSYRCRIQRTELEVCCDISYQILNSPPHFWNNVKRYNMCLIKEYQHFIWAEQTISLRLLWLSCVRAWIYILGYEVVVWPYN